MVWILLLLPLVIGVVLWNGDAADAEAPGPDPLAADPLSLEPVEALARFGVSDDAERLIEQGHGDDLAGLGYDPDGG